MGGREFGLSFFIFLLTLHWVVPCDTTVGDSTELSSSSHSDSRGLDSVQSNHSQVFYWLGKKFSNPSFVVIIVMEQLEGTNKN